jgi:hypothetical protein
MKSIEELAKEAEKDFICPYLKVCQEEKYNSCYNHSHVLCDSFDDFYSEQRRYISVTNE